MTEFFVTLEKDPQQEDFLQGRMPGNPYSSNEPGIGPLMRDIKNKICQDCDLVALLEDDSGMEVRRPGEPDQLEGGHALQAPGGAGILCSPPLAYEAWLFSLAACAGPPCGFLQCPLSRKQGSFPMFTSWIEFSVGQV